MLIWPRWLGEWKSAWFRSRIGFLVKEDLTWLVAGNKIKGGLGQMVRSGRWSRRLFLRKNWREVGD